MAERESAKRSERIKNGLERRKARGMPVGRQTGAKDTGRRQRAGWESGQRRAAHAEAQRKRSVTTQAAYQARAGQEQLPGKFAS